MKKYKVLIKWAKTLVLILFILVTYNILSFLLEPGITFEEELSSGKVPGLSDNKEDVEEYWNNSRTIEGLKRGFISKDHVSVDDTNSKANNIYYSAYDEIVDGKKIEIIRSIDIFNLEIISIEEACRIAANFLPKFIDFKVQDIDLQIRGYDNDQEENELYYFVTLKSTKKMNDEYLGNKDYDNFAFERILISYDNNGVRNISIGNVFMPRIYNGQKHMNLKPEIVVNTNLLKELLKIY